MVSYETVTQLYVVIVQQMLHLKTRDATKNNSIIYILPCSNGAIIYINTQVYNSISGTLFSLE